MKIDTRESMKIIFPRIYFCIIRKPNANTFLKAKFSPLSLKKRNNVKKKKEEKKERKKRTHTKDALQNVQTMQVLPLTRTVKQTVLVNRSPVATSFFPLSSVGGRSRCSLTVSLGSLKCAPPTATGKRRENIAGSAGLPQWEEYESYTEPCPPTAKHIRHWSEAKNQPDLDEKTLREKKNFVHYQNNLTVISVTSKILFFLDAMDI